MLVATGFVHRIVQLVGSAPGINAQPGEEITVPMEEAEDERRSVQQGAVDGAQVCG